MKTLVISPHPDDETLGCGGTILKRKDQGNSVGWLIVTGISEELGWSKKEVEDRNQQIESVRQALAIDAFFDLGFPPSRLDTIPMLELVESVSSVVREYQPEEILVPYRADVHSDHRVVSMVVASCVKWFRSESVTRVLAYEVLSETDQELSLTTGFQPTYFVDISNYIEKKLDVLDLYATETDGFPFPRSRGAVAALARVRGAASGFRAAEAYSLLRARE